MPLDAAERARLLETDFNTTQRTRSVIFPDHELTPMQWMTAAGMKRRPGENDMEYALRWYQFVQVRWEPWLAVGSWVQAPPSPSLDVIAGAVCLGLQIHFYYNLAHEGGAVGMIRNDLYVAHCHSLLSTRPCCVRCGGVPHRLSVHVCTSAGCVAPLTASTSWAYEPTASQHAALVRIQACHVPMGVMWCCRLTRGSRMPRSHRSVGNPMSDNDNSTVMNGMDGEMSNYDFSSSHCLHEWFCADPPLGWIPGDGGSPRSQSSCA